MYDCSLEGIFNRWNAAEVFWWTLTIRGNSSSVLEGHRSIADFFLVQLAIGKSATGLGKSLDHSVPLSVLVAQPCAISTRCVFFQTKERINNTHPITSRWCHDDVQKMDRKRQSVKVQLIKNLYSYLVGWKPFLHFLLKLNPQRFAKEMDVQKRSVLWPLETIWESSRFCHILCSEILGKQVGTPKNSKRCLGHSCCRFNV